MFDMDNRVVQLEKNLKVINGHLAKVKEEVMKDLQKQTNDVNNVKMAVDNHLVNSHKEIRELSTKVAQIFDDN